MRLKNLGAVLGIAALTAGIVMGVNTLSPNGSKGEKFDARVTPAAAAALPDMNAQDLRKLKSTGTTLVIDRPAAQIPMTAPAGAVGVEAKITNEKKAQLVTAARGAMNSSVGKPIRAVSLVRVTIPGLLNKERTADRFKNRLVWAVQVANASPPPHPPIPEPGDYIMDPNATTSDMVFYVDPVTEEYLGGENIVEDVIVPQTRPPGVGPNEKY